MIGWDRSSKIANGNSHPYYSLAFCHFIRMARRAHTTRIFPIHSTQINHLPFTFLGVSCHGGLWINSLGLLMLLVEQWIVRTWPLYSRTSISSTGWFNVGSFEGFQNGEFFFLQFFTVERLEPETIFFHSKFGKHSLGSMGAMLNLWRLDSTLLKTTSWHLVRLYSPKVIFQS